MLKGIGSFFMAVGINNTIDVLLHRPPPTLRDSIVQLVLGTLMFGYAIFKEDKNA